MRIPGNDQKELFSRYLNLTESSVANTGTGTPTKITVDAAGSRASGGINVQKGRYPGNISNVSGPGGGGASGGAGGSIPYEGEEESCGQEQVEMAMSQLLLTADKALHVFQQLQHGGKLEAWTASKITLCADYIETVADYMHYNGNDEEVSDDSVSIVPMEIESEDMIRR